MRPHIRAGIGTSVKRWNIGVTDFPFGRDTSFVVHSGFIWPS